MTQPEKSTETPPPTKQSEEEPSSPAVSVGGVSAETLAQIQAMMDSKVAEERARNEVVLDDLRKEIFSLRSAQVPGLPGSGAFGPAEEARLTKMATSSVIAALDYKARSRGTPVMPDGLVTFLSENPFDPSNLAYQLRKAMETLTSIINWPSIQGTFWTYEAHEYGDSYVEALYSQVLGELDDATDLSTFSECQSVIYREDRVIYLNELGSTKLRDARGKLLKKTNDNGALAFPKLARADRNQPGHDR